MYSRLQASAFLVPPPYSFWRWSEGGQVLCWRGGETIAFLPEIEGVLEALSEEGFPPLTSVALVLGACRGPWQQAAGEALASFVIKNCGPYVEERILPQLAEGLDRLSALPERLRHGRDAKAALCRVIFEGHIPRRSPFESCAILEGLREDGGWRPGPEPLPYHDLIDVTRSLSNLADRLLEVDAATLDSLAATGLERVPEPEEVASESLRDLIEGLQEERDELGQVARLARRMLAAFALPRRVSSPDSLPIGGFSGLSNSGPLDRLVASELAYDDLSLAARIANKEALYWRREAPPRRPPSARRILLDCGLRMWGSPRLHGLAAALALMAGPGGERAELLIARGTRAEVQSVRDRDDLGRVLGVLEPEAHPGAALNDFFADHRPGRERVIITCEEVLDDPDFERAWIADDDPRRRAGIFVLSVSRGGAARLSLRGLRGWKLLKEARIEPEALAADEPGRPLVQAEGEELPPLFFRKPFPLRLPAGVRDARRVAFHPIHGYLAATRDGRLLSWEPNGSGADQLSDALPRGQLSLIKFVEEDRALAILLREGAASVVQVSLRSSECRVIDCPLPDPMIHGAAEHRGALFFVVNKRRVHVLRSAGFEQLESVALPSGARWVRGRFFERGGVPYALSYDGLQARLEKVPVAGPGWWVFDRQGHDGPWVFDPLGRAVSTATGRSIEVPGRKPGRRFSVVAASPDGHRLLFRGDRPNEHGVFDLARGDYSRDWGRPQEILNRVFEHRVARGLNLRKRFKACGLDNQGRLVLRVDSRRSFRVQLGPSGETIELAPAPPLLRVSDEFRRLEQAGLRRYRLRRARLGGFRLLLDGRGLLHLIPDDGRRPSIALVLLCKQLAVWFSDGAYSGPGPVLRPQAHERRIDAARAWRRLLDWLARAGRPR